MAHNRLLPRKEPAGSFPIKLHYHGRLGESPARCIQSGALFAEGPIIRAIALMIPGNIIAFHARRVVVVNGYFICGLFRFR
jgi:hypothetical protein